MRPHMDALAFNKALGEVEAVVRDANRYFDNQEPWKLKKSDPDRMSVVLAVAQETLRCIAISYQPFMPGRCGENAGFAAASRRATGDLAALRRDGVAAGTVLPAAGRVPASRTSRRKLTCRITVLLVDATASAKPPFVSPLLVSRSRGDGAAVL